jgi:hypothetical protein
MGYQNLTMKTRNQKGMTLIGFIIVLSIALFVSYLGMKIGPIYVDYYGVVKAMDEMATKSGNAKRSPAQLRTILRDRLYMNYSTVLKTSEIKIKRSDGLVMRVKYDVREPLLGNLDVIVSFDNSVVLPN